MGMVENYGPDLKAEWSCAALVIPVLVKAVSLCVQQYNAWTSESPKERSEQWSLQTVRVISWDQKYECLKERLLGQPARCLNKMPQSLHVRDSAQWQDNSEVCGTRLQDLARTASQGKCQGTSQTTMNSVFPKSTQYPADDNPVHMWAPWTISEMWEIFNLWLGKQISAAFLTPPNTEIQGCVFLHAAL